MASSVLIVDDAPVNLSVIIDVLEEAGFHVFVAESGASALLQLKHLRPDIILLDLLMPGGIDGFETCRRIKAIRSLCSIPIIFLTAVGDSVNKVAGLELGAVDYITKPFDQAEVIARIKTHIRVRELQSDLEKANRQLEQEIALRRAAQAELQESLDRAVLVLFRGEGWELHFCTMLARSLMQKYFGSEFEKAVPAAVAEWLDGQNADQPYSCGCKGGTVTFYPFRTYAANDCVMLLLVEEALSPSANPQVLQALGLTLREAEVLFWIAQGKTSPEIALICQVATPTIKKHVHHILSKLEVETRGAAALKAIELLGLPK